MKLRTALLAFLVAAAIVPTWQNLRGLIDQASSRKGLFPGPEPVFVLHPKPLEPVEAEPADFIAGIQADLAAGNYDALEAKAAEYRHPGTLFRAGIPKLSRFYRAFLSGPGQAVEPSGRACDCDFSEARFDTSRQQLEAWLAAKPDSAAAHIALAKLWYGYSWNARGGRWPQDIPAEQWPKINERLAQAAHYMIDPKPEADPEVLYTAIDISAIQTPDHELNDRLYHQAIGLFPWYYPFYGQHGRYLQQNWLGKDGELDDFLYELSNSGGSDGLVAYSFVANQLLLGNQYRPDLFSNETGLDFVTTIKAYQVREERYGLRDHEWNSIFYMTIAAVTGCETGHLALVQTEGRWSPEVWGNDREFYESDLTWFHANSKY